MMKAMQSMQNRQTKIELRTIIPIQIGDNFGVYSLLVTFAQGVNESQEVQFVGLV